MIDEINKRVNAVVKMQVMVEVTVGSWDSKSTAYELHKAGAQEGSNALHNLFAKADRKKFKIIGAPDVKIITFNEAKDGET